MRKNLESEREKHELRMKKIEQEGELLYFFLKLLLFLFDPIKPLICFLLVVIDLFNQLCTCLGSYPFEQCTDWIDLDFGYLDKQREESNDADCPTGNLSYAHLLLLSCVVGIPTFRKMQLLHGSWEYGM